MAVLAPYVGLVVALVLAWRDVAPGRRPWLTVGALSMLALIGWMVFLGSAEPGVSG